MSLPTFTTNSPCSDISKSLQNTGAVIVHGLASKQLVSDIRKEFRPAFDEYGKRHQDDFNGYQTLRLTNVLKKSFSVGSLIANEMMMQIIDPILLPNCKNYQIGSMTAIEIQPGEGHQQLHTDGSIYPISIPGIELQVSVLWALDDFTLENGATRVIPFSHKLCEEEKFNADRCVQAVMPKGSALFYLGSVVHGGGKNSTKKDRMALVNTYSLGWLRQEVNQYLVADRETVMQHPLPVQRLIGYQGHGAFLGRFEDDPDGYWLNKSQSETIKLAK